MPVPWILWLWDSLLLAEFADWDPHACCAGWDWPRILKRVGEFSLGHAAMIAMLGSMWMGDHYSPEN